MKKLFAILLALSLLCLCACGSEPADSGENSTEAATEPTVEATEAELELIGGIPVPWEQPEEEKPDFSAIDELTPNADGVYQIHTAQGVASMANHPDGKFELLWNVDMQGEAWTPIAEFTGEITGNGYTISNFTVTAGENTGFIGVNKGTVTDLYLDGMTVTADSGVAGGIAAVNEGAIRGCKAGGTMTVNGNTLAGGLVGKMSAGTLESSEAALRIEAQDTCVVGLLAGSVQNVTVTGCKYTGAMNTKGGQLFTDLAGARENASFTDCLWRDNSNSDEFLSEESLAMRETVVSKMRAMGTFKWVPQENIMYIHPTSTVGNGVFIKGMTYHGMPYTSNFGSYERFRYSLNEDGTLKDFVLASGTQGTDIFDTYMGNDCSGAVYWSWTQVSNTTEWTVTQGMIPSMGLGTVPIGTYDCGGLSDTMAIMKLNGEDVIAETYTQLHKGDAIVTYYNNPDDATDHINHTRLIVEAPTVMRDQAGKLNVEESYVIIHGQGDGLSESYPSSWEIDQKYTFRELLDDQYIAISCQELVDGKAPECTVTVDEPGEGKAYMSSGIVESNYRLISTTVTVTDSTGAVVFEKTLFTSVHKYGDFQTTDLMRETVYTFDLAAFAMYLRDMELTAGESYTYTLSAMPSTGENVVVKSFEITG